MKFFLIAVSLFICSINCRAKNINLISAVKKKAAIISGILAPASLSFNGQEIEQSSESYEALLLNDEEVKITEVGELKTFYVTVDKSLIDLQWKKANAEKKAILKIQYPAISEMHLIKNNIFFKFNALTTGATLDTQNLKIVDSAISFPVENLKQWLEDVHSMELTSTQKSSQIYNLDFQEIKADVLTNQTWTLYRGKAPFYANGNVEAIGIGYRVQTENLRSSEFIISYSKANYDQCCFYFNNNSTFNTVDQRAFEFKFRSGWNPFVTNFGDINYKRLTIGLQGEALNYKRNSTFQTSMDGFNSDHVDQWFFSGGPFFKWEPLQLDHFGFSFNFDFKLIRSSFELNRDGDMEYLGLSYTF